MRILEVIQQKVTKLSVFRVFINEYAIMRYNLKTVWVTDFVWTLIQQKGKYYICVSPFLLFEDKRKQKINRTK